MKDEAPDPKPSRPPHIPSFFLGGAELLGLLLVFSATLVSLGAHVYGMVSSLTFALDEILLLFVYLEIIAMIGIYSESHRVPVRYPVYIAITALARYLVLSSKGLSALELVFVALAILALSASILLLRFCEHRFPNPDD